jgi:flagellar basal-body rod protein FlgB
VKVLFNSVDRMERELTFHRARHTVLAGNLANLDTPRYEPVDLVRERPEGATPAPTRLAVTQAGHLSAPDAGDAARSAEGQVVRDETVVSHQPDGNGVSLDRELAKLEANRIRYQMTSELVARRLATLKYAAGGGA